MNSGKVFTSPTSQTISFGMAAFGVVLLGTALSHDAPWRTLWYALPTVAAAVGLSQVVHRWREFLRWQSALKSQRRALQNTHDDELARLAQERALVAVDSKGQGLDYRAKAIRSAQISIWLIDVVAERITFEGVHVGSREFLPETRIYQGREWYDRLHPQEVEQVEHRYREFIKQRTPEFEMEYRVPDERGGWRWILSRGLILENDARGHAVLVAGTHTDIHQRKLAQIAYLQERALFNTGPVVLFRFSLADERRVIDFMSGNAARLWGFGGDWSVVGEPASSLVHAEDLLRVRATVNEALANEQAGVDCQFRVVRGNGSFHWHNMRVLFETERGVPYARGYLIDIEDRKQLEASAHSHNRHLSELVQQLNLAQADSVVLQETSDMLNSAEDVTEAFEIVRRAADAVFPGWSGALSAVRSHGGLSQVGQWGKPPGQDTDFDLKDCWGLRRGKPHGYLSEQRQIRCNHIHVTPDVPLLPYVCVPMSANGETVGALHLFADQPTSEDEVLEVEARAERFAETLKLAMSNLRLRAWLRDQATRDGLTGLYNRRLLDERLPIEIKRSQRDQMPASLAMIDVDHFKRFNDEFGHDAGDHVLKTIGELLMDRVRVYDLACRYGGEEMVLLMPSCQMEDAALKLETIRRDIANLQLNMHGRALPPVTVSIGLAFTTGGTAESLLRRADEALYAAKRQGRNRLITHSGEHPSPGDIH
ncbi:MAG: sensor domain-containing diguanylate cyclase [Rubrivivax sp.]|nr:MAG: sensor domain-containing diguanylate cyclase [Rubrivivax sp.]